jgi:hypothetical protein
MRSLHLLKCYQSVHTMRIMAASDEACIATIGVAHCRVCVSARLLQACVSGYLALLGVGPQSVTTPYQFH